MHFLRHAYMSTLGSSNMTHTDLIMNGEQKGRASVNAVKRQSNSYDALTGT